MPSVGKPTIIFSDPDEIDDTCLHADQTSSLITNGVVLRFGFWEWVAEKLVKY